MTLYKILDLFQKHWPHIPKKDIEAICYEEGGIDPLEGMLLYLQVLERQPILSIEFSPHKGYSTMCIGLAIKAWAEQDLMHNFPIFYTFEINEKIRKQLEERIQKYNLELYVNVIWGDAIKQIPETLADYNVKPSFVFVDSDHRAEFAERYINNVFPLLNKDALVVVHDLRSTSLNPENPRTEFDTSLLSRGNASHCSGEEQPLKKWLNENGKDYCVLHAITGGNHEGARLKRHEEFYDQLRKITSVDFRRSNICPKTVWFEV
jgi:predicted O-methyltransferase YrrM